MPNLYSGQCHTGTFCLVDHLGHLGPMQAVLHLRAGEGLGEESTPAGGVRERNEDPALETTKQGRVTVLQQCARWCYRIYPGKS